MRLVLEAALSSLWAMEEEPLRRTLEIARRDHNVSPQALEAYRSETLKRAERATVRDGVAIVNVEGPLFKRANLITEFCGASSYDVLRRDLQVAIDNPAVRAILLNVDSPGGEAAGTGELASAIRGFRGTKPIVAYAGDLAASAAYWIASAADRIVIGSGAALGSIGVRSTYSDASARDEKTGVRRYEFVSSQSPYKATDLKTDEGRARVQARVDALAQVFVETVADNRGASVEHVLAAFGRGDVLIGQAAITAGMADEIGTFEETLAALAVGQTVPLLGRQNAASAAITQEDMTMTEAEIQARIDAAIANQARDKRIASIMSSVRIERERAMEIIRLTPAGLENVSSAAIRAGKSVEDYRHEIAAESVIYAMHLSRASS